MTNRSKVQTRKQKALPRIKELAKKGDVAAMRTLCKVYGYEKIKVNGKLVNLEEI